jgi:hypothetical protein
MAVVAVKRPRGKGESRYVDYLPDFPCFKISHTYNEDLIHELVKVFPKEDVKCIKPEESRSGSIERRWWRLKATPQNCLKLLRWGLEGDYRFTRRALLKLDEVAKNIHAAKYPEIKSPS